MAEPPQKRRTAEPGRAAAVQSASGEAGENAQVVNVRSRVKVVVRVSARGRTIRAGRAFL